MGSDRHCLGVPNQCDYSRELIARALDGQPTLDGISRMRVELGDCLPCVQVLDVEVRFKLAMSQACRESAPLPCKSASPKPSSASCSTTWTSKTSK